MKYNFKDFIHSCSYPTYPKCILGKFPNYKFGGAYKFDCHTHPLTLIEETKDHPPCHICNHPCEYFIYQCANVILTCTDFVHWKDKCSLNFILF